jgi:hypothetical protein
VPRELDEGRPPRPELNSRRSPIVRDRLDAKPGSLANPTVRDQPGPVPARHLPIPGVIGAADVPRETPGPSRPHPPVSGDQPTETTPKGHLPGAVASVIDSTAHAGRTGAEGGGSVTEAATQGFASGFVGKVSNGPVPAAELQARMERFPELRGMSVPDGPAARFPELGEPDAESGAQQPGLGGDPQR